MLITSVIRQFFGIVLYLRFELAGQFKHNYDSISCCLANADESVAEVSAVQIEI